MEHPETSQTRKAETATEKVNQTGKKRLIVFN